jgi:hypothetical protein
MNMKQDIFALLKQNGPAAGPAGSGLPTISVWQKAILYLTFFTIYPEKFSSHYDQDRKFSYLCLGDDCLACLAGVKATEHIYMPVWDVQNRRIVALRFDARPEGPARRILPFLQNYRNRLSEIVAVFDCEGRDGEFTITAHTPLPSTDRGALECREFCEGLEAGTVDLRNCVRRLTSDEIGELPSVNEASVRPVPLVGDEVMPDLLGGWDGSVPVGDPVEPIANGRVG